MAANLCPEEINWPRTLGILPPNSHNLALEKTNEKWRSSGCERHFPRKSATSKGNGGWLVNVGIDLRRFSAQFSHDAGIVAAKVTRLSISRKDELPRVPDFQVSMPLEVKTDNRRMVRRGVSIRQSLKPGQGRGTIVA